MDARGIEETELISGAKRSTLAQVAEWTKEAHKVLVFRSVVDQASGITEQ